MTNHFVVAVALGIKHESFLHELQLVHEEHQENTDQQRNKRGVESDTEALRNAGNIALNGLVGLSASPIPRTVPMKPIDGMAQEM